MCGKVLVQRPRDPILDPGSHTFEFPALHRTALALVLSAAIAEIGMGGSPDDGGAAIVPDLVAVSALLCKQRKGVLRHGCQMAIARF